MNKHWRVCRGLAAVMLTAALCGVPAQAAEGGFSDVAEDAWYAQAVSYVQEHGLMSGTGPDTFSPELTMTRGMVVTVLYRAAGSPEVNGTAGTSFADVPEDAWFREGVSWARQEGIADGYSQTEFGPNDTVTREQLVTMLWRCSGSEQGEGAGTFTDEADISPWAAEAVDWASVNGLITGKLGNFFDPGGPATRGEGAVILANYHQQSQEQPEEGTEEETEEIPAPQPEPAEPVEQPSGTLAENPYDSDVFVIQNGFLTYQGDTPSYIGVDVSAHQGEIEWDKVAAAGVEFAMIRVGYRGYTAGDIYQDAYFQKNITGALDAGLDVGIYFFSQATSIGEAREEALQTLEWIRDYEITYPIVFDWERISNSDSRTRDTTGATITACARTFCNLIEDAGYTAMTYGSPSKVGKDLDLTELTDYAFWLAHYTADWQPTSFQYFFDMWQYSSQGYVDGISGRVDLNICFTNWTKEETEL